MSGVLRELLVSFGFQVDTKQLEKGDSLVDSFVGKLASFGKLAAGAFAVDAIVSFGREILNDADALAKQSQALGVSAAELQGWQHAAQLSGSSAEEFGSALTKFTRNVNEAGEAAAGPAAKAFKALGVEIKDSTGKIGAPIELLDGVVAGLEGIQDPAKRTALVMDLFGKSGAKLLPLFSEGPEGLRKLRAEVQELGFAFDDAFLENAQEVNDNVDRLKLGLKGLFVQALGPLLPGLVAMTQTLVSGAKSFVGWIKGTKMLQAGLAVLAGNGLFRLAKVMPALITRFGGWQKILMRLGLVVARFIAPLLILEDILVFLAGGKSAIGKGLDAAFGAGTAAKIQALVAEMVKFFALFKSEPDNVRKSFAKLPEDLEKDLGSFGSFLGGWGQSIVDVGLFAVNALTGGWDNFVAKAKAAVQGYLLIWKIVMTEIKFAGLGAAAAMSDAFDNVWNGIVDGARAALNAMLDVMAKLPGTGDLVRDLRVKVDGLSGGGAADAGETISKLRDKARLAIAHEGDAIGALATAPAGSTSNVNQTANVVVNVPPGTPADVARDVGAAASKGTVRGLNLRGTKAALVPVAG